MRSQRPDSNFTDILESFRQDIFYRFNAHRVGIVESIDTALKTASVRMVDRRTLDIDSGGKLLKEHSLLVDCPIIQFRSKLGGVTIPLKVGDTCLILFNDRDLDNWFETGVEQELNSARAHHLSDGVVLPCLYSAASSGDFSWNTDVTQLSYDDTVIELDGKIKLSNSTQSLFTIMNDLLTALLALHCITPNQTNLPINSATNAALTAVQTKINGLLKI